MAMVNHPNYSVIPVSLDVLSLGVLHMHVVEMPADPPQTAANLPKQDGHIMLACWTPEGYDPSHESQRQHGRTRGGIKSNGGRGPLVALPLGEAPPPPFACPVASRATHEAVVSRPFGELISEPETIHPLCQREIWAYPSSGRPQGVDTLVLFPATPGTHGDWLVRPRLGPRLLLLCGDGRALLKAAAAAVVLSLP
ncbi:hypothetical protein BHE74_00003475 [Ensete ventricosum]|nr:hypothetical protein BHE74_00003475 [Ensete ventricosum]RZR82215.1 hypothetical protein BHM03_00008596 [Ensete ventricosum]